MLYLRETERMGRMGEDWVPSVMNVFHRFKKTTCRGHEEHGYQVHCSPVGPVRITTGLPEGSRMCHKSSCLVFGKYQILKSVMGKSEH